MSDWEGARRGAGEDFYDARIAPKLLSLGKACEAQGLSLVAVCGWEPGEYGRTNVVAEDAGLEIRMTYWAAASQGNIDKFLLTVCKWAEKHGHSSVYLSQLGVPYKPESGQ